MSEFKPGDRVRFQHVMNAGDNYNGRTATVQDYEHWRFGYIGIMFEDGPSALALAEELTPLTPPVSLYEKVLAMGPGTVFRVGDEYGERFGAPWMKTVSGILDLIPYGRITPREDIPSGWMNFYRDVVVLYTPPLG